jgi:two-component system chemotaxis sensor kinase CheA
VAIELRQFHQTFFDESFEGLASMETALLRFEQHPQANRAEDREALHAIFRVVHSIKGGSGTFGFGWIADFSHLLESMLDDLRDGRRTLDRGLVGLLLRSVDSLRNLLEAARSNTPVDKTAIEDVTMALEDLRRKVPEKAAPATSAAATERVAHGWRIRFVPKPNLFRTGNDPLRILRELARLGELKVHCDTDALPDWRSLDPESCYLGWTIDLAANVTRAELDDVFAWVVDDAQVDIAPLEAAPAAAPAAEAPAGIEHTMVKLHGTSLRVSTQKVDTLMDVVGELVITQTMLQQTAARFTPADLPRLVTALTQLERNVRELQEGVMSIRLLPLGFLFSRLPRLVRDIGEQLGKRVELRLGGEQTELDKTVIERISDPILHMVRNSMDHGIESPTERRAAGKPEVGTIRIEAQQKGGNVIIELEDDGRGLDYEKIQARAVEHGLLAANTRLPPEQLHELIFLPGMTTSDTVTDLSGRGVGLDVVRNNIRSIGGNVEVTSERGKGARFIIRLPLTLAILDGLGLQVGDQTYILPLVSITESVRLGEEDLERLPDGTEVFALRKDYLPLVRLHQIFGIAPRVAEVARGTVVIIEADNFHAGLLVDEILGQQQVVLKSLETHYRRIEGVAAATILGDGTVALILDAGGLIRLAHGRMTPAAFTAAAIPAGGVPLH